MARTAEVKPQDAKGTQEGQDTSSVNLEHPGTWGGYYAQGGGGGGELISALALRRLLLCCGN